MRSISRASVSLFFDAILSSPDLANMNEDNRGSEEQEFRAHSVPAFHVQMSISSLSTVHIL